jgi:hypothetical protein
MKDRVVIDHDILIAHFREREAYWRREVRRSHWQLALALATVCIAIDIVILQLVSLLP